ncbi:hypothetical protein [Desulfogranum japonicum]|uniref:hypothetical protein n=1 Tax=Desulfogranum japonicum TaxID=231447 RepID=UPI00129482B2|nr:hypothetical protein [Desulfogranum japonicum]
MSGGSAGIVWIVKSLWAPLVGRFGIKCVAHYRGWLLLTQTGMVTAQERHTVTGAAYTVGYNNLGYFAKLFLAEFCIPPHNVI